MIELLVQYSTSTAFTSQIIRRLCHSPFSHVDVLLPGEGLLGVSGEDKSIKDPGGVLLRPFDCWPYLYPPKVARLTVEDTKAVSIIWKLKSQIGKPFDDTALWSFLSDNPGERDWRETSKWFCSEWLIWGLEEQNFFGYPLITSKSRVSPADSLLMINPFMTKANIMEFIT